MMARIWLAGLLGARAGQIAGTSLGIAIAVSLLALLGVFFDSSMGSMTERAIASVSPDWQVQVESGADADGVKANIEETAAALRLSQMAFADVRGFHAQSEGTEQTTGAGKVVGLAADYLSLFPRQVRLLAGTTNGVLLAQQTAANLHASVGDRIRIARLAAPPVELNVDGVIDLPFADSLFQPVGEPPSVSPRAPPDNVLLLPLNRWNALFGQQLRDMPSTASLQFHLDLDHRNLPATPIQAYDAARQQANKLEAALAGEGRVGNNLAVRLDAAREDSLYALVLFLFLGAPGAVLGVLLAVMTVEAGAPHRSRDRLLLRLRGATTAEIINIIGLEALIVAVLGIALGVFCGGVIAIALFGLRATRQAGAWLGVSAIFGLAAILIVFLPPLLASAQASGSEQRRYLRGSAGAKAIWRRGGVDFILIALALLAFWLSAGNGYQVVLAPEGVPATAVDYKAFLAPAMMWIGCALLMMRLCSTLLRNGRSRLSAALWPVAGTLSGPVAATLSRSSGRIAQGIALVAVAFSFAASTAIFNTTYNRQAAVDATLTNGADVSVTGSASAPAGQQLDAIRATPGVAAAEPMQHRYAYVGSDLQDLYGINAASISAATEMSNAYFAGGNARATLDLLQRTPDGVLVSDETVQDFQLTIGDIIKLRLQAGPDRTYTSIPFRFIGIVREFPTAPHDSFLVANAGYVARQTGNASAEIVLIRAAAEPVGVAKLLRQSLGSAYGLTITEIGQVAQTIGSTLVAVDLSTLTAIELGFAIPLTAAALALIFGLNIEERRRSFVLLTALGAKARQLGSFLWGEALVIYIAGGVLGLALGVGLAWMLVRLMTGVFDPPPDTISVPWLYIFVVYAAGGSAMAATVLLQLRDPGKDLSQGIRKLG